MHETTIAQNVIEEIEQRVKDGTIEGRVSKVFLQVGRLRGVLHENLTFLFDVLSKGSSLEGARLEIETIPVRVKCLKCKEQYEIGDLDFLCARCRSAQVEVISGTELLISAVEVY